MPTVARILFLADTHLGLDLPFHPRVEKTRRGPDFFANFRRALQPALDGQVDLVIHGGDLFYRSRIPLALVEMALEPLVAVAERGVPVFLVPGNHERSRIPLHLWTLHPLLHIFDRHRTFTLQRGGQTVNASPSTVAQNGRGHDGCSDTKTSVLRGDEPCVLNQAMSSRTRSICSVYTPGVSGETTSTVAHSCCPG